MCTLPGSEAFVVSSQASLRVQNEGEGTERLEAGSSSSKRPGRTLKNNKLDLHLGGRENEHSFALRMKAHEEQPERSGQPDANGEDNESSVHVDSEADRHSRRVFLSAMLSTVPAFSALREVAAPAPASAFERSYPNELTLDGDTSRDLATIRGERIATRKAQKKKSMDDLTSNPAAIRSPKDLLGSAVWAGALWLLSGSRSNPLVTPLANVLYDENEDKWVKDRNDGLFAPLPPGFLFVMGVVFLVLGVITDRSIMFLTEGDSGATLQLAGVALIGGGSLELGRIASGDKKQTREDSDRDMQLEQEFAEFAAKKLIPGGSCHRSEVVASFRRYFAQYRVENDEYPLNDLEIERLLRAWNRMQGNIDMSSAGFFKGISINQKADLTIF